MKRQTQQTGVRKYFGDDLVSLQSEPLRALDAIFAATGACVISGCEVAASGDKFDVAPGIVALHATDRATASDHIMVMPFAGVKDVVLPIYLVAECDVVERVYGDGRVKPISYNYFAAASGVKPAAAPSLEVGADGAMRFADAMQAAMAEYASVTADEKASWNAKESAAGAQAKADAALIAAKSYADNSLISAKGYADSAIAALVNGSPAALDTLRELAAALGGDPNFATTVMNAIGERVTVAAFNAALAGKADAAHTHNYAAVGHTHSDYAAANHSHSGAVAIETNGYYTKKAEVKTTGLFVDYEYPGFSARAEYRNDGITLPPTAIMDMPGVLCVGQVNGTLCSVSSSMGILPVSVARTPGQAKGVYRLQYPRLATGAKHWTIATINGGVVASLTCRLDAETDSYIDIRIHDNVNMNATVNSDFNFVIYGENKW